MAGNLNWDGSYLIITLTGFYKTFEKFYEIRNHKECRKTQSCGRNLQSITHSNLQLEAGAYNRRKKIGISSGKEQLVLPLFYGNQERASSALLKPKDEPL